MSDILEVLRQRRLKSARSSVAFGEASDAAVSQRAKLAKATLAEINGNEVPKDAEELRMASIYYRMVDEYYAKSSIRMPSKVSKRGLALWRRVVRSCTESQVEPEQYLRAQFQYFHKAFGRPPELRQLATDNAKTRAREFAGVKGKIVGNDIRHKGDIASIMRNAEKQMQDICRAQSMTREEVYRNLVLTGLMIFPKEYLAADPVYQKVKNAQG